VSEALFIGGKAICPRFRPARGDIEKALDMGKRKQ